MYVVHDEMYVLLMIKFIIKIIMKSYEIYAEIHHWIYGFASM